MRQTIHQASHAPTSEDQRSEPLLWGRAIASAFQVMHSLGPMGRAVLDRMGIHSIELDRFYPAQLRTNLFEAAHSLWGDESLYAFGLSMASFFRDNLEPFYRRANAFCAEAGAMNDCGRIEGIEALFEDSVRAYERSMRDSIRNPTYDGYGIDIAKVTDLNYRIVIRSTSKLKHWAFPKGILLGVFINAMGHEVDLDVQFQPTMSKDSEWGSICVYKCFITHNKKNKLPSEIFSDSRLSAYESLLSQSVSLIHQAKQELDTALKQLEKSHDMVMASIRYASLIQTAQLPRAELIAQRFTNFGLAWEPRDQIGGDIWWLSSTPASAPWTLALADCAGHGVPGAMLSLLVTTGLERIFDADPLCAPSKALARLSDLVRQSLNQDRAPDRKVQQNDGFDAAVFQYDPQNRIIQFASANIDLWVLPKDGPVQRISLDRFGLGYREVAIPALQEIRLEHQIGNRYLICSDGFTDQVGGNIGQKGIQMFGKRRVQTLLNTLSCHDPESLVRTLMVECERWRGENLRRDDITILAFSLD